jgi:hypothetical protein
MACINKQVSAGQVAVSIDKETFGFSLSMLSLMAAPIVSPPARAWMVGCNKRAWQVERSPTRSSDLIVRSDVTTTRRRRRDRSGHGGGGRGALFVLELEIKLNL